MAAMGLWLMSMGRPVVTMVRSDGGQETRGAGEREAEVLAGRQDGKTATNDKMTTIAKVTPTARQR